MKLEIDIKEFKAKQSKNICLVETRPVVELG